MAVSAASVAVLHRLRLSVQTPMEERRIGGGHGAEVLRLRMGDASIVLKTSKNLSPLQCEARSLQMLAMGGDVAVVGVKDIWDEGGTGYLLLEWLAPEELRSGAWSVLGASLARLHQRTASSFGLDHDNWIASLRQANPWDGNWWNFWTTRRFLPLLRQAETKGLLQRGDIAAGERLCAAGGALWPQEPPSLLHGDLWSGNVVCSHKLTLIDPSCYFGHREMDLAMAKLFGGFPDEFFAAYHSAFPLGAGWESRLCLGQLYPLLVHMHLFGELYVEQFRSCLSSSLALLSRA